MKKRIISFLLSLCMVWSLLPGAAWAEETDSASSIIVNSQSNDDSQSKANQESNGTQQPNGNSQTSENQKPKDEASSNGDETKKSDGSDNGSGSVGGTQQSQNTEHEQSGDGLQTNAAPQTDVDSQRNVATQSDVQPKNQMVIYVAGSGNDDNNDGTEDAPFATLARAVEVAADGATIYVMSDLTMTKCARFFDKHLTITSDGENAVTITREGDFAQQQDNARSTYNPAMVEVQGASAESVGLTLKNIILDDANLSKGTVFAQAISGEDKEDNTVYVQDAIIASNATVPCTITLDEGAVLRNFGGMSAVRATDKTKIVMESGSVIEDTIENLTRTKGTGTGTLGPAGAVWIQGGTLVMENGSKIQNVNGRAVYADGGTVTIGGTISGITANSDMWQGTNGTVVHLRNNAEGTLTATASITGISGGNAVYCGAGGSESFKMENGSKITDCPDLKGNVIYAEKCIITINGEISNVNAEKNHILQTAGGTTVTIGENGAILNNHANYGAIYINGNSEKLDIYGKINGNICTDRGGGVVISNNGGTKNATMYPGAEISGNYCAETGGGIMVCVGTFTMKGGTISNNAATCEGGGVYVRKGGSFIMEGGTISGNATTKWGGGVCFQADDYNGFTPKAELNGGTIENNKMSATITVNNTNNTITVSGGSSNDLAISSTGYGKTDRYLSISDEMTIGNKAVYFQTDTKTVTPADNSLDIKLGNTSTENVTKLVSASNDKGWQNPLATFWAQRDGAATLSVGGLTTLNSDLPVYVLVLPVNALGMAEDGAKAQVYAATKDNDNANTVNFTILDISGDGYAIAIVQPKADYGTLTISGPASIQKGKNAKSYSVTYTVTYTMSESMKTIIQTAGGNADYSLTINQDTRLTGTPGTFDGSSIEVTYTLPSSEFTAGESLFTSAELTITIGTSSYTIPSNVVKTQMIEAKIKPNTTTHTKSTSTTTVTATATPVVTAIGAIPKTGDDSSVTLWLGLCVASALALGGVSFYCRKKR